MDALVSAISDFIAAILARFGYVGRARRRANIKEDLELLDALRKSEDFGPGSSAHTHLAHHIAADVARFSGVELKRNKIIPWGSIFVALAVGLPFGYLTVSIVEDGFAWYAVPPAVVAGLMLVAAIGMLIEGQPVDDAVGETAASDPYVEQGSITVTRGAAQSPSASPR